MSFWRAVSLEMNYLLIFIPLCTGDDGIGAALPQGLNKPKKEGKKAPQKFGIHFDSFFSTAVF